MGPLQKVHASAATLAATAMMTVACVCASAPAARAAAQFTLDARADSFGPVVTDSAGNGYVAWEHTTSSGSDVPMFCKLAPGATRCGIR